MHLSWRERFILGESFLLLGIGRATVLFIPFKRIAPHLGVAQQETPYEPSSSPPTITTQQTATQHINEISNAILLARRMTPWNSNCFAQALAGHLMLRRRRYANTLYLGVRKEIVKAPDKETGKETGKESSTLAAHAWLRNGNLIVTGKPQHENFTVIARYGWQPRAPQEP